MRVHVCAVGRLRTGPEKALVDGYLERFGRSGARLGLGPARVIEIEDRKKGGAAAEAGLIGRAIPDGALVCALDERGRALASPAFADQLALWRDEGRQDVAFAIGGADGLDGAFRARADFALSLGPMVWPHMLVRVMLAEQLWRAVSILGGHPYHRA